MIPFNASFVHELSKLASSDPGKGWEFYGDGRELIAYQKGKAVEDIDMTAVRESGGRVRVIIPTSGGETRLEPRKKLLGIFKRSPKRVHVPYDNFRQFDVTPGMDPALKSEMFKLLWKRPRAAGVWAPEGSMDAFAEQELKKRGTALPSSVAPGLMKNVRGVKVKGLPSLRGPGLPKVAPAEGTNPFKANRLKMSQ